VLIDERTANLAEVTAAGYRSGGCALLVGRTTSGLAMMVERHGIPMRGSIEKAPRVIVAVPNGPIRISPTLVLGPEGVVPDLFVPPGASEEVWQATVNKAREQLRK
jgi:C-terminal processing protease CtpA/Prc